MLDTALAKKRLVGLLLAAVILALFLIFNRFPKLDTVQGDLEAVTSSTLECFQSFCIDRDPDSTFFSRWWEFSLTYLRLVSVGMVFAFVVAGLTEAFLFPTGGTGTTTGKSSFKRTLKGLAIGPVMNLCSACIVPISSTFRKTGVGIEGAISMIQGSATLNIPSLIMVAMVFTPLLGVSRLVMGVAAALLIGPLVVMVLTRSRGRAFPDQEVHNVSSEIAESARWGPTMREAFTDWARATVRFVVRLGPIMILAGFASGLVMQWTSPDVVETYLGNNVMGIAIAATFGLLINVPLLFEIPLVALLLLLGMGTAPCCHPPVRRRGRGAHNILGAGQIHAQEGSGHLRRRHLDCRDYWRRLHSGFQPSASQQRLRSENRSRLSRRKPYCAHNHQIRQPNALHRCHYPVRHRLQTRTSE